MCSLVYISCTWKIQLYNNAPQYRYTHVRFTIRIIALSTVRWITTRKNLNTHSNNIIYNIILLRTRCCLISPKHDTTSRIMQCIMRKTSRRCMAASLYNFLNIRVGRFMAECYIIWVDSSIGFEKKKSCISTYEETVMHCRKRKILTKILCLCLACGKF